MSEQDRAECAHDSRFLTVTGRERTGDGVTWAILTCRCGKLWTLADDRKVAKAEALAEALKQIAQHPGGVNGTGLDWARNVARVALADRAEAGA